MARVPRIRITAGGWAMLLLAVVGWGLGGPLAWTELRYLGTGAVVVLVVGLLAVLVPRPATASIAARPARTSVGATTAIELSVRARLLPIASPVVRIEGDVGAAGPLRLRTLWPGRTRIESFEHLAERRGIFELGPVLHELSDPLGQFRRTRSWGTGSTLWVRPRVLVPGVFADGGVFDLEGLPSDQISMSDLAFHALREYVPGDDLRRVHWRSSAKAATLLVRQYQESRSRNAAVLVDDAPGSYADAEEFETAISVAASLAIRALTDGFDVDLACGDRVSTPVGRQALLDETCAWGRADPQGPGVDVLARAMHLARTGTAIGIGVVVTGSSCDVDRLLEAAAAFGEEAHRLAVRVDPQSQGGVRDAHGVRVLEIRRLDQLPELAEWAAR